MFVSYLWTVQLCHQVVLICTPSAFSSNRFCTFRSHFKYIDRGHVLALAICHLGRKEIIFLIVCMLERPCTQWCNVDTAVYTTCVYKAVFRNLQKAIHLQKVNSHPQLGGWLFIICMQVWLENAYSCPGSVVGLHAWAFPFP